MDPFELAQDIGIEYHRWYFEHMFMIDPASGYVAQWLQSFRDFSAAAEAGQLQSR